jgi:predicted small secreted protein
MKRSRFLCLPVIAGCLVLFAGCPNAAGGTGGLLINGGGGGGGAEGGTTGSGGDEGGESGTAGGGIIAVTVPFTGGTFYYSLSTGQELTDPAAAAGTAWDIAFTRGGDGGLMRTILTNSGVTAEETGSGGQGGVWYTDKTWEEVTGTADRVDPPEGVLAPYVTDRTRWVEIMSPPAVSRPLNIMTYVGYRNEETADGSEEHPFTGTVEAPMPYLYDKKQFYRMQGTSFYSTGQVYIVRHGDGGRYSKITIEYTSGAGDEYSVRYENLPEEGP